MKKHFIALLSMMMCFVLSVGIFTACDTETEVPKKYTISFYDGDELVDTIETYGNEEISMPAAPKKEGFTFKGWFSDKGIWKDELTKDTFVGQVLTEDVNVYAYYLENETPVASEYTITFYIDGEAVDSIETSGNERLTLPAAPEKDDHTFEGWFFDNGTWQERLTANTYEETPLTEDVSVYAYYKKIGGSEPEQPQEYTVIFEVDHGTPIAPITTSRIDEEPQTTRDGYTFAGWYKDGGFVKKAVFPYEVTEDQTLYAKWEKNKYTVHFDTDGGTYVSDMIVSAIDRSPETTKDGYEFEGWYTDKTFSNKISFPYEVTEDQTLYAKWEKNKYTVHFDTDGGTYVSDMIVSAIDRSPETTKDGYEFEGWYTDKTFSNKISFPYEVTEDQTLYAKWEKNKYTVHFDTDGGTYVSDMIVSAIDRSPETTKDGYEFEGWYTDKTFSNKISFPYEVTEDQTLYAKWEKNKYTVHFDTDGGTYVSDMIVSAIDRSPETTKDGYEFEGWYTDKTFSNKISFPYEVTEDQTLYAKWEKNKYTVHFDTDGGTYVSDMIVSAIDRSPETTKDGYEFEGWYTDKTFSNKISFPYEVTEDQTLYAKWTQSGSEKIVFSVDANGVLTGVSGLSGSDITVEIPSEVNGITVTEIGKDVFKDNKNVGRLIIPDSVTKLGYRMCSGCTALSEVRLPSGLTVIPDEAFDGCSSLRTVNFPDTLKEIRSDAFCGTDLTEFIAPDSLTEIWSYAFKDCSGLVKVDLKNVSSVSGGAFQSCTALRSVRLSDKLTELPDHLFDGCTSLAEIDMPDNPIAVSSFILNGTAYYNDQSNWDGGVLYADGYLIAADKTFASLTEYTVKAGTLVIADDAFSGVGYTAKLKKMTLPDGLYRIGQSAFSKLYSLTEINIPDSVRSVGYGAFSASGYDTEQNYTGGGLYVGNWLVAVQNDAMTSFTVREGTVGVADGKDTALFPTRAQKITQLTLPSSLKYIGARSFARLHITDLELPSGLQTLGEGAFSSCSWLKTVNLGECTELESIGAQAFTGAAISEITIPESVASMGELVFNHNTVDLTVICEVAERPEGWDPDWSYTYRQGTEITVEWKNR